jgi:hypothetical protein
MKTSEKEDERVDADVSTGTVWGGFFLPSPHIEM